ncbi:hypothetical protein SAMN05660662_2068 [Blastococcus aurantiacus]|uniref:Uncharacterized protein n=1 Tax=Blastococcus aurantiacus TaxID=1550231 RepID=A0A1G7KU15_9ACTN|nr:hypothetical protein [Blastococcus aurantiacus]SDF40586.1 hypothetical protein SAMN05660662_2068 [Blastococcus aurantiacus]
MRDDERALTAEESCLAAGLEALLYRHDPIGIAFGDNPDEYSPEARALLPRLVETRTVDDVQDVVHAVFVQWLDEGTAGPRTRYRLIAEEISALLRH